MLPVGLRTIVLALEQQRGKCREQRVFLYDFFVHNLSVRECAIIRLSFVVVPLFYCQG